MAVNGSVEISFDVILLINYVKYRMAITSGCRQKREKHMRHTGTWKSFLQIWLLDLVLN